MYFAADGNFSSGRAKRRAELNMENLSQCAVWVCPWAGILFWRVRGAEEGCRESLPALGVGAGLGLTNCCSPWCSRVPANCCSSRPGASRASEEMLCCQCWKSVHLDPAVFLICQRLKIWIELSCAGIRTGAACPVDSHILLGIKHSCTISPVLTVELYSCHFL